MGGGEIGLGYKALGNRNEAPPTGLAEVSRPVAAAVWSLQLKLCHFRTDFVELFCFLHAWNLF